MFFFSITYFICRCKSYELGALVEKCLKGESDEMRAKLTPDTLRKAYGRSEDLKTAVSFSFIEMPV